jgi:hypothetical protein
MKASEHSPRSRSHRLLSVAASGGFTFVELLVAASIAAITLTAAAVAYSTISSRAHWTGGAIDVTLPTGASLNFYGFTNSAVSVNTAPNLGELARSEYMREMLEEDLRYGVAVFCLARNDRSGYRPSTITPGVGFDGRSIVQPNAFRGIIGSSSNQFTAYTGAATNLTNTSLFIMERSTNASAMNVRAVYESDFVPTTSPVGVYATVRRYVAGGLTAYYHVFYPGTNTFNFGPPVVFFDRAAMPATGTVTIDRYRQAQNMPFYLLFWPDPTTPRFWETNSIMSAPASSSPRAGYSQMADRTSYYFVIPAFPAL